MTVNCLNTFKRAKTFIFEKNKTKQNKTKPTHNKKKTNKQTNKKQTNYCLKF